MHGEEDEFREAGSVERLDAVPNLTRARNMVDVLLSAATPTRKAQARNAATELLTYLVGVERSLGEWVAHIKAMKHCSFGEKEDRAANLVR